MKKVTVLFLLICTASLFSAPREGFGVGFIAGEPTGFSFKSWTGGKNAWDGAVAWSTGGKDSFHIHADYLFHNFKEFKPEQGRMPLYYGIGARIRFEDRDDVLGIRAPLGINYIFHTAPLDIFFEIVPVLNLAPDTDVDMETAVGIRYFFKTSR